MRKESTLVQSEQVPSREDVELRLNDLIAGRIRREPIADWAKQWILPDAPHVDDPAVWRALTKLAAADMVTTDRPYLYGEEDFRDWLAELENRR
jgi:hypothetical protein